MVIDIQSKAGSKRVMKRAHLHEEEKIFGKLKIDATTFDLPVTDERAKGSSPIKSSGRQLSQFSWSYPEYFFL